MRDADSIWQAFADRREAMRDKKRANIVSSLANLKNEGIVYDKKSETHYKVFGQNMVVDFWPSTGLWIDVKNDVRKRGVKNLIVYIKNSLNESKDV